MSNHARILFVNGRSMHEGGGFDYDAERMLFRFRENLLGGRDPDIVHIPWVSSDGCMRAYVHRVLKTVRGGTWFEIWTKEEVLPGWLATA